MSIFTDILFLLQHSPLLAMAVFAVLGLCVGSFLNVVIYRTPVMMEQQFLSEARFGLRDELQPHLTAQYEANDYLPIEKFTLSHPASRCPKCGHHIRWYENIPVISWLVLRGRCSDCHTRISPRYPFVEIITAILSVLVIIKFGVSFQGFAALILTWMLIALTGIDFDTQLLPDRFTLPLAALGLAVNSTDWGFISPVASIWGYIIGFLCLWVVYKLFLLVTGKHGMGYGDFKLLGALGAWFGALMLPFIILASAVMGAVIGGILMRRAGGESKPFAFGPFIAIAGMVALLYGNEIMQWYLGNSGL